jgi:hypothetical protein
MNNATRQRALTVIRQAREMTGNKHAPATVVVPKARKLAAAVIIQRRYRKPITNEKFIKLMNRTKTPPRTKLARHANTVYGTNNLNLVRNIIYNKRHVGKNNAARTIQAAYARYSRKKLDVVYNFIERFFRDKELKYYGELLNRLYSNITQTLGLINQTDPNNFELRKKIVVGHIGHCHMNSANVPRKYLSRMYAQLVYVARAFHRMTETKKLSYLERLKGFIQVGPCLENALDSLVEALVEPVFNWKGKRVSPLVSNNARYLTHVVGPALATWGSSNKNLPAQVEARIRSRVTNNKEVARRKLSALKKLFWDKIKNLPLHVMTNQGPVFARTRNYNVNGRRFYKSNVAAALANF